MLSIAVMQDMVVLAAVWRKPWVAAFRQLLAAWQRKLAVAGGGRRRSACPAVQLATRTAARL